MVFYSPFGFNTPQLLCPLWYAALSNGELEISALVAERNTPSALVPFVVCCGDSEGLGNFFIPVPESN